MQRFGFWMFSLMMLVIAGGAYGLLRLIYKQLFGGPLPIVISFLLLGVSVLLCAASFAYRYAYEGHGETGRPMLYGEVKDQLLFYATFGLFFALTILWQMAGMWWGFTWVGIYFGGEILISSVASKRVFAERLWQAKIWFPEMTLPEQESRARAWAESGLEPVEYEVQNRK